MLSLYLHAEDTVMIGDNIRIQAIPNGGNVRIYIDAPRELLITRGINKAVAPGRRKTPSGSNGGKKLIPVEK